MKAIEQYFHVVLFIMLYKVVLTFKSLDETLVCDHSNESYWAVLSCGTVYYAVQGGSYFFKISEDFPVCFVDYESPLARWNNCLYLVESKSLIIRCILRTQLQRVEALSF